MLGEEGGVPDSYIEQDFVRSLNRRQRSIELNLIGHWEAIKGHSKAFRKAFYKGFGKYLEDTQDDQKQKPS